MKCFTIEHDCHGIDNRIIRNNYGSFETMGDADRYVQDVFPDNRCNPVIKPATANAVCEWGRSRIPAVCPTCRGKKLIIPMGYQGEATDCPTCS